MCWVPNGFLFYSCYLLLNLVILGLIVFVLKWRNHMKKQRFGIKWMATAGLGFSLAVTGIGPVAVPAYAAVEKQPKITQEKALSLAKQWGLVPDGYKVERIKLQEEEAFYNGQEPEWSIEAKTQNNEERYIRLSAETGKLISFSRYQDKSSQGSGQDERELSQEKSKRVAEQFLQMVTDDNEREELSAPNQYQGGERFRYMNREPNAFLYTRVVNGIPFLENGLLVILGEDGVVQSFRREWYQGSFPEASKQDVDGAAALEKSVRPSLAYVQVANRAGLNNSADRGYSLVYQYGPADGAMVDAKTGEILNVLGKPLTDQQAIKPLQQEDGKEPAAANKVIARDDALAIAQQLMKKFPGTYKLESGYGSGSSRGEDGIERNHWSFGFEKKPANGKKASEIDRIGLEIDDRGYIIGYSTGNRKNYRSSHEIEKPVEWKKAKEQAEALVRILYPDRLDNLYVSNQAPTVDEMKDIQESGRVYQVEFGRLKNGIVIEGNPIHVQIDAETGNVVELKNQNEEVWAMVLPDDKASIDAAKAREVEAAQMKAMLTYYREPIFWGPYTTSFPLPQPQPKLVYRYVGDEGLVNASTGEWMSFNRLMEGLQIQDIANHPMKRALQEAVDQGWLNATDGRVYPDQPIGNVDYLQAMLRLATRSPVQSLRRGGSRNDEIEIDSNWVDVAETSPDYDVIGQALRYKLIEKTGTKFDPKQPITRAQAAKMALKLLGYEALLDKPELFRDELADVDKKELPLAALSQALGLFGLEDGKQFAPDVTLTRADAAQLFLRLSDLLKNK